MAVAEARSPQDEYETDSGDDFPDREDEDIAPVTASRSVPIFVCLAFLMTYFKYFEGEF